MSPLRYFLMVPVALALLLAGAASSDARVVFRAGSPEIVPLQRLVAELSQSRVVVFGESHDNPDDHVAQRTLIQALHDAGVEVAIGMEMFWAEAQPHLDAWVRGELDEKVFAALFAENWDGTLYPMYYDILSYARQEKIPLVGLNVPKPVAAEVSRRGPEGLDAATRARLGPLACDVSPRYMDVISKAMGPGRDKGGFERFCQAQVLWDAVMARTALSYLEKNPKCVMVILAGNYHAWKYGIPEQLRRYSRLPVRVVLPSSDKRIPRFDILSADADYVWRLE